MYFCNSPSPAVATLGLRKAAETAETKYGDHVTKFVQDNFYVDDGLTSCPTPEEAIHILKDTQSALKEFGYQTMPFYSNCLRTTNPSQEEV